MPIAPLPPPPVVAAAMKQSVVKIVGLPAAGAENPATLAIAAAIPMRLMVRNTGGTTAFLAHTASEIQGANAPTATGVYELPPNTSDVFVLAPKQGLWAVGIGAGGRLSFALSEAVPTMKLES